MGRILIGIIVGFVLWTALWLATGAIVTQVMPEAAPVEGQRVEAAGPLVIFVVLSVIISIVSGFVAVKLAPASANKTGWILAVVLFVVGLVVEIVGWETTAAWYHIVFLVLLIPSVLVGARLGSPKQA